MMDITKRIGQFITSPTIGGESYRAYVPNPLPPTPTLNLTQLYPLIDQANTALGRLDGICMILPDASLFLYMYIRKEAVLSSQIEGTQSSLSDLLLFENEETPSVPLDDVEEVSNYVAAMNYGLERLKELPLSLRLIREIHSMLMSGARGGHKQPGEFRTSQNWIGGTRPGNAIYVPPPPGEHMENSLNNLEKFLHDDNLKLPILIKAALAHVQFESIHPFLDGNGRLGRLLITFILCNEGILRQPLLYLSLYLKTHRQKYYELLQTVRETGNWEAWTSFFLAGVIETATQACDTAQNIVQLFKSDRNKIDISDKATANVLKVYNFMQRHPLSATKSIKESCEISLPTTIRSLNVLEDLDIIAEITGKERHKLFAYKNYLRILNDGAK